MVSAWTRTSIPCLSTLRKENGLGHPFLGSGLLKHPASPFRITKLLYLRSPRIKPSLAIIVVLVGHLHVCIPATLNGYDGCIYGINFPVLMRSTFGVYSAYFPVFIRGVVACICKLILAADQEDLESWLSPGFGTQSFQGRQCIQTRMLAIWPSFKNFHITSQKVHMSFQHSYCASSFSSLPNCHFYGCTFPSWDLFSWQRRLPCPSLTWNCSYGLS
jgi:hypothetical protein